MKLLPPLTDEEYGMLCKGMDVTLRATGLEFSPQIAAVVLKLNQVQEIDLTQGEPVAAAPVVNVTNISRRKKRR